MIKRTFRPSANLIATIGQDIIKDTNAAIVELVKNAYDADASICNIKFELINSGELLITIEDDGHGMSEDIITSRWLVPSTDNKLRRYTSPKGRIMQGRKGIGRFAAAILGDRLEMTTTNNGVQTTVEINWKLFSSDKYLDEIAVDLLTENTMSRNGTRFKIFAINEKKSAWSERQYKDLMKELKKLLTPLNNNNDFIIEVEFKDTGITNFENRKEQISAYPLLNYYDYRLCGTINSDGSADLTFENTNIGTSDKIEKLLLCFEEDEKFISSIYIDLRVFDRDPESIDELINRIDSPLDNKLGKNETKNMLNEICGIYIYRNGFRIRPYGDSDCDWLSLDKQRVQSPATKIGMNQIAGYIIIKSEEESKLFEKSARDGLKEDEYYLGLVAAIKIALIEIENRRYSYRKKTGKGRKSTNFYKHFQTLIDYSSVRDNVIKIAKESSMPSTKISELENVINEDIKEKEIIVEKIEREFSVYQGQATLGKMVDVIIHESRKPIGWLKSQTSTLKRILNRYNTSKDYNDLIGMIDILNNAIPQLQILSNLISRIDPLATRKASSIQKISVKNVVENSFKPFLTEISKNKINIEINCSDSLHFIGWEGDLYTAITNIIENAVYWVCFKSNGRKISAECYEYENTLYIEIYNNGPTIPTNMIESGSLFEPHITGKPNGTGLGLPISGEAVSRNKGRLTVEKVSEGAKFIIQLPKGGV